jgi:dihydroneopterin aldolase
MAPTPSPAATSAGDGRLGDRIEIRGLRVTGVHGVLPEERRRPQPFALDVDAWVDTTPAAGSDDLADTVDYGALCELATRVVTSRRFALVEALADAVARAVLAHDERVAVAAVSVHKLRPPVPFDVASVGVRVTRRRDRSPGAGEQAAPAGR